MALRDEKWLQIKNCRMCREGGRLVVQVDDRSHNLHFTRGWAYIVDLISEEGIPVLAGQLEWQVGKLQRNLQQQPSMQERMEAGLHGCGSYSRQEVGDWKAVHQIKHRLSVVMQELALAQEFHNYGRVDDLTDERDQLLHYLRGVLDPRDRLRHFPNDAGKQRLRVLRAINRSLDQLAGVELDLAKYLRWCLEMREWFVYRSRGLEIRVVQDLSCLSDG